jgi:peptidyl-prolyl cis-trans isomerase C
MTCPIASNVASRLPTAGVVRINDVTIARDAIAREVQQHPASSPIEAWRAAARALAVRELLLQEARRLGIAGVQMVDDDGRRETVEEAAIRELIAAEVRLPEADEAACRRYYQQNHHRFRSPEVCEAAHILLAAADADARERACALAQELITLLRAAPHRFEELARAHSACPSAAHGGNLGRITPGATTPEFERALAELAPGSSSPKPVVTRYGVHIIRLDRRHAGRELPFELIADRIADYLRERVERQALAQYLARLAARAKVEGIDFPSPEALRVH